jgi:hypothetical protein
MEGSSPGSVAQPPKFERPERAMAAVAEAWGSIGVLVRWVALPSVVLVWTRVTIGSLERPTPLTLLGGAMIVGAGLLALRSGSTPAIAPSEVVGAFR